MEELDATRKQLEILSKQYEELQAKSKEDIRFLAKEFKSLQKSQAELKDKLGQSLKEKSEVEVVYGITNHALNIKFMWKICYSLGMNYIT